MMAQLQGLFDAMHSLGRSLGLEFTWLWFYIQLGLIAAVAGISLAVATLLRRRWQVTSLLAGRPLPLQLIVRAAQDNLALIVFAVVLSAVHAVMLVVTWPGRSYLLGVAASLAAAWIVINLVASQIRNKIALRTVAMLAWLVAALSILGQLDRAIAVLDGIAIHLGGIRVSVFLVLKTTLLLLAAIWAASVIAHSVDRSLRRAPDLSPSLRVLIGKLARVLLFAVAMAFVLNSVGIDLSALVVFSGAVGVGIGFGLQKIVSNFISGIILLADKSIKPGDVITVGESYGWVEAMGARYCSVLTRDGREFLIPNEQLVTETVVNWSHSSDDIRVDVTFGVAYSSDPHQIRRLAIEALADVPRVRQAPAPICHLTAFGDFSLDFVLRFWISDPAAGVTNVRGVVLLKLWDIFNREGVSIPFPVRDIQPTRPLHVVIDRPKPTTSGGLP
ncbi:MAG: mechanosensitive ion channel [Acetobacteraceae bacterium]|nr:mechanosensitive ion channel [Acetobacteraceae bacterium]